MARREENTVEYVVIVIDALGRRWQSSIRTFSESEIDAAVSRERKQNRARGLDLKVEKKVLS